MALKRLPDEIIRKLEVGEKLTREEGILMRQRFDELYAAMRGLSPGELVCIEPIDDHSEDLILIRQTRAPGSMPAR